VSGATAVEASKSTRAYEWIRDRIRSHDYTPGHRLVIAPIADALGMSAVPVREAIRRLEAEGLVTFEHNIGARVALVDEQDYVHTMQTLGLVEGLATALSAPLLLDADLQTARAVNERMRELLGEFDSTRFTRLNQDFHAALYERCPNPHLLDLVHRGWARLSGIRDSTFAFVPGRASHSVEEHERILDLIATDADPLEIELAARDHRWRTLEEFLRARHPDQHPRKEP
jgi:DNA-binding GntR family transcriptional regulator